MSKLFNETKNLKLIGRGLFTKVYELNSKEVLIESSCRIKENYSLFYYAQYKRLIPELKRINYGYDIKDNHINLYKAEKLQKVTCPSKQLKPRDLLLYKELRSIQGRYRLWDLLETILKVNCTKNTKLELGSIVSSLGNYSDDIILEVSPRNIMLDSKGNLLLNDIFACAKQAKEIRTQRTKRY